LYKDRYNDDLYHKDPFNSCLEERLRERMEGYNNIIDDEREDLFNSTSRRENGISNKEKKKLNFKQTVVVYLAIFFLLLLVAALGIGIVVWGGYW